MDVPNLPTEYMGYWNTVLLVLFAALAGCTTVSINSGDGQVKIERTFGVAYISVSPNSTPIIAEMTSLGFSSNFAGYTVGFSDQEFAAIPESCKVIFWIKNKKEAELIKDMISENKGFCSIMTNN